jgi:hypothetical protein
MANTFESRQYTDDSEVGLDNFKFKSAGKKYVNQNYKDIGLVLGIVGADLGSIKRQANQEKKLPNMQGEITLDQINFYREHYGFLAISQSDYENILSQNNDQSLTDDTGVEYLEEVSTLESSPEQIPNIDTSNPPESASDTDQIEVIKDEISSIDESAPEMLFEEEKIEINPQLDELQSELSRLVTEAANKLNIEQEQENNQEYSSRLDREKIERFTENARQAIQDYQKFASEHSSPFDNSNAQIQERYRQLEKIAWNSLYNLAHALDGEIATLPTDRDIQLSHPEGVDTKQYLESRGYEFNEDGDITYITDKGVKIELNRAMKTDYLIKSRRPSHIIYDKSISLDSDGDYHGYLVRGLNQHTPDFIVGVLDKEYLEPVIVDETKTVSEELVGQTPDNVVEDPESTIVEEPKPEQSEAETVDGSNTTLKLESTSPNLDKDAIIEEYRQIGFNEAQLAFIKQAIDAGDTTDQIALYAKPGYELAQMIIERAKLYNTNLDISQYEGLPYWQQTWIITGILAGHTPEQIALYAKSGINSNEIEKIQSDIRNGLTIEQINEKNVKKRAEGHLNNDWGFSRDKLIRQLESEELTNEQVTQAIDSMDINWDLEAIKRARRYLQTRPETEENWSKNELIRQLMSDLEQFTDEQARFAVDNISEYDWKEDDEVATTDQSEVGETTQQGSLEDLRLAYARAEEAWNRKRGNEYLKDAFIEAREAYNSELERVLKLQVAQGQEANIHELFKNEVISLREQRIVQSQELQGTWEKKLNPLKEKFVNFVIKHKKLMSGVNLGLGIAGGIVALTGFGIPLAGGLAVTRRAISGVLLGVSSGEGVRSLGEDADINLAWGKIKFQAVIPKLVKESLASSEDEFKKVSDNELKDRLGTLEAYYRLNGGKFTNNDQQKAYEKILIELGHRVRVNTLENYQNTQESSSEQTQDISANQDGLQESVDTSSQDNNSTELGNSSNTETFNFGESRYTSELLNTISDKRVQELDKFRRKRKIATVTGIGVGLLVGGAVHALDGGNKPEGIDLPESKINPLSPDAAESNISDISPNPSDTASGTSELSDLGEAPSASELPPTGAGEEALSQSEQLAQSAEATRAAAEQAAEQLAQDVSSLDPGETIWGEVAKQLGENATDAQIQQAVENLLQSEVGQDSIYKLAQGTEGGRALLAQWGIDNATEMAELSKEQLYEISRYLAPGELQGITELSLENLTPFEAVEAPQVDVSEAMDNSTPATEASTPSVEPTLSAAPEATDSPEVSPIAGTEFTENLSKALGANGLTESQLQNVIYSFATSENGSAELYNQIISNDEGVRFLSGFGVNSAADFANLRPDELYEIAQTVGVDNLDKLTGFELNDIILSQFEDAPDTVELIRGSRPLDVVNQYIANELGNLPYDSTLGQQVLNTYINTPAGKEWLYESIVSNPNPNNQNVQMFREYLSFKGIKSAEEFKQTFDWAEFSGNKRIPTSAFWNYTRLPNGNMRIAPLSTFLQPGKMVGIPEAIRQVLTKQ